MEVNVYTVEINGIGFICSDMDINYYQHASLNVSEILKDLFYLKLNSLH